MSHANITYSIKRGRGKILQNMSSKFSHSNSFHCTWRFWLFHKYPAASETSNKGELIPLWQWGEQGIGKARKNLHKVTKPKTTWQESGTVWGWITGDNSLCYLHYTLALHSCCCSVTLPALANGMLTQTEALVARLALVVLPSPRT